LLFKTV